MRKIREHRRELRFPNNLPIKIIVDNRVAYKGIIQDISPKGAFVVTNGPFHIGQKLVIDFRGTKFKYEKRICKIVRVVPNGVAILFDNFSGSKFSTSFL